MTGFVYKWHDVAHDRFYIGSHYGSPDDGYICSSKEMKREYRLRPLDFKREILEAVDGSRFDVLARETEWLKEIPDSELGKRYYNKSKNAGPWWVVNPEARKIVTKKMSEAKRGKKVPRKPGWVRPPESEETKKKRSQSMKIRWQSTDHRNNVIPKLSGRKHTKEARDRMSASKKGSKSWIAGKSMSAEHKAAIGEANRIRWALRKQGFVMTEEYNKRNRERVVQWSERLNIRDIGDQCGLL